MFLYTVKDTESESDIQNINLLYKTHQQHQNTFLENTKSSRKPKIHILQTLRFQNDQRFMAMFMARLWRAQILIYIYIYIYIYINSIFEFGHWRSRPIYE